MSEVVEGVVVGATDFGEAHRVVRLLSAERGLVSLLARGARRSKKRFAGMLDVGTRLRAQIRRGRGGLSVFGDVDRLGRPRRAREELERIALLAYGCELCGALAAEDHPAPKLSRLLAVWLELLEGGDCPGVASLLALEAKALTFAGVAPSLVRCAHCGGTLDDPVVVDPSAGGALHGRCGGGRGARVVWLSELERLRRTPLADTVALPLANAPPRPSSASEPLWSCLRAHLGRELRSRALVQDVL